MLIDKIDSPKDLKKLKVEELPLLASEIREGLFNRLTKIGGHFGPNFGFVEATIALHYVFDSPNDKFVFYVSHQAYAHKMLTGRKAGYFDDNRFSEDSGYTNPDESEHDFFNIGHTSTSIALALGLAKGRDILGKKENIVAIIGDGSLSGGEALEALSVAGSELNSNFIVVVNDNEQAIAETHGGLYKNLKALRDSDGKSENNMFRAWGLDYIYEENGNDIASLIAVFEKVRDSNRPVVVHIHTQKGKGYELAEKDKNFVVVTPAMPMSVGLGPEERAKLGSQYIDTGIAEEAAVAIASGIARRGAKPLVVTNMTFLQRAYDQISQDVCINKTPVTMLMNYSSFDGLTDVTHLGIFGLAAFTNIPNLVVLCPSSAEEYISMLDWSLDSKQKENPVLILIPGNDVSHRPADKDYGVLNRFKIEKQGEKVAILALGDFFQKGKELASAIKEKCGFTPSLINPRFASGLDEELLHGLEKNHQLVLTFEDGILEGGFGQKIASFYGPDKMLVKNYGLKKQFYDRYNPSELLQECGMMTEQIVEDVKSIL